MAIGIRTSYVTAANVAYAASTALTTVGLTSPIAAGETQLFRAMAYITASATGGVRAQVVVPAGSTIYVATFTLYDTIAPLVTSAIIVATAAFTNALANAGNHFLVIEGTIINGATAGNLDVQFAQNTAANTTTILRGSKLDIVKL